MFKIDQGTQLDIFKTYFTNVKQIHNYSTRLSSQKSYRLPPARTNYGIFNIRFQGPKVWNSIDESIKKETYIGTFKNKLKEQLIQKYSGE